jgi:tetratricopeptide (TPR) repeat protein
MAMLAKLTLFSSMACSLPLQILSFQILSVQALSAQATSDEMAEHAQAAIDAEKRDDFATAVQEYEKLASLMPTSPEVQSNLGVALYFEHQMPRALAWYQQSNPDAAVPELAKAAHLNPSDATAHLWLGYAYQAQGRQDAAAEEFTAVTKLDPQNVDAWYALGETRLEIGKDLTRELLAVAPDGARAWELAGQQCQMVGEKDKALQDFQKAYARRPDIPELDALLVSAGGTFPPESTSLPRAAPGATGREGATAREDDLYRRSRDAEQQSKQAFEQVVQLAPDSYRAHQIMADSFIAQKQDDKAIEEYRNVLRLKPDLPGIHQAIGEALIRAGKLPDALDEFQAEIKLQPRSASAHMDAGRVLLMMGKEDDAQQMLTASLKLDRPPLETYVLEGKLDVQRKDYRGAIDRLTHYTSLEKGDSTAYYLLAMSYRGLGDKQHLSSAMEMYRKTSEDARERSHAQQDLESSNDKEAGVPQTPGSNSN